jgi:hypothetical protein
MEHGDDAGFFFSRLRLVRGGFAFAGVGRFFLPKKAKTPSVLESRYLFVLHLYENQKNILHHPFTIFFNLGMHIARTGTDIALSCYIHFFYPI